MSQGAILIWSAKNPREPDRQYEFPDGAVCDLAWSVEKPNLLAIGFLNGIVRVIDVSKKKLSVIRETNRKSGPSQEPYWQVQWWSNSDLLNSAEQIFTSNQDGRIVCFLPDQDFRPREILRIRRLETDLLGEEESTSLPTFKERRHPGAIVLRRHPTEVGQYLVGTDEGVILYCLTSYTHHHLLAFKAHLGPIRCIEFSPFCGKFYVTCGMGQNVKIWVDGISDEPLLVLPISWKKNGKENAKKFF